MVGTAVLAIVNLFGKEWDGYKKGFKHIALALYVFLAVVGVVSLHVERSERTKEQGALEGKLSAASTSIDKLTDTVNGLEAKVATEPLRKELTIVKEQLQNTQRALAPGPKAKLVFTFVPYERPDLGTPLKPKVEIAKIVGEDRTIHITMSGMNVTGVDAIETSVTVRICSTCKFFSEPAGFIKATGGLDTDRDRRLGTASAFALIEDFSFDVIAPSEYNAIVIHLFYRCQTCTPSIVPQKFVVNFLHSMVPSQKPAS